MSVSLRVPPNGKVASFGNVLRLRFGGTLEGYCLGYELTGPSGAPLVLVQGGISAGRHVAANRGDPKPGWWDSLVGRGKAIDTRRFRVLSLDYLGGDGLSCAAPGLALTSRDQAEVTLRLLQRLELGSLHAFVGASYGGMVGLAFAEAFPWAVERCVVLCAAHRSHPLATAWRCLARRVIALGLETGREDKALAIARGIGMSSYRGADELAVRFSGPPDFADGEPLFPIAGYLEARGRAFAGRMSPQALLRLLQAIDLHRVEPGDVKVPTTLIASKTDRLVPVAQTRALARSLPRLVGYHELESTYGHDAFLKESALLAPLLGDALEGGLS